MSNHAPLLASTYKTKAVSSACSLTIVNEPTKLLHCLDPMAKERSIADRKVKEREGKKDFDDLSWVRF